MNLIDRIDRGALSKPFTIVSFVRDDEDDSLDAFDFDAVFEPCSRFIFCAIGSLVFAFDGERLIVVVISR